MKPRSGTGLLILIAGYVAARTLLSEPALYSSVSGVLPSIWWTSVFGKLVSLVVMIALIGRLLKDRALGWTEAGWGPWQPAKELRWAAACALGVWIGSFLLPSDANTSALQQWTPLVQGASGKILFFLSACLLTGILEELVYRGGLRAILCGGAQEKSRADAVFILASAAMFAAFHSVSTWGAFAVYMAMGALFAATLVLSGSLRAVMLAHVLVNTAHLFGLGSYFRHLVG